MSVLTKPPQPTAFSIRPSDDSSAENAVPELLLSRLYRDWNITADDYVNVDTDRQTSSNETAPSTSCLQSSATSSTTAVGENCDSDDDDCGEPVKVTIRQDVLDYVQVINSYCVQPCAAGAALLHPFGAFTEAADKPLTGVRTQSTILRLFQRKHEQREDR